VTALLHRTARRYPRQMPILGLGLLLLIPRGPPVPGLLWNSSHSVPVGLYWLTPRQPKFAELAVILLPDPFRSFGDTRGYLPAGMLLIKPTVARVGDVVCRIGPLVTVQGRSLAYARPTDRLGRPLPHWRGCSRLAAGNLFVLSAHPDSFDSRYFGLVERRNVVGTAAAVLPADAK